MSDELGRQLGALLGREVSGLRRLSGGASRETWSFDAGGRPLILQRQRPGAGTSNVSMAIEVGAAAGRGRGRRCRCPAVVADATDGAALGAPAFVVERFEGETIARKLLRDDEYAAARPRVAAQCGAMLAAIHRIPVDAVARALGDATRSTRCSARSTRSASPTRPSSSALRWLDAHRPDGGRTVGRARRLPHRQPHGRPGAASWPCSTGSSPTSATRSRTSAGSACGRGASATTTKPAGGFGAREELWAAYEAAGGAPVDPDAARWWEIYGTLRWGVICIIQAASHRLGLTRSMELAAIGRRTCENEHDVLALLPGRPAPARRRPTTAPAATGRRAAFAPHDGPSAAELAEAVREWLEGDVPPATEGRVRFHARVAANVLGMLERELRLGPAHAAAHRRSPRSPRLRRRRARWRRRSAPASSTTAGTRCAPRCGRRVRRQARRRPPRLRRRTAVRRPFDPRPATLARHAHRHPGWNRAGGLGPGRPAGLGRASTSSSGRGRSTGPWRRSTSCSSSGPTARCRSAPATTPAPPTATSSCSPRPWDGATQTAVSVGRSAPGQGRHLAWPTPSPASARSSSRSCRPAARWRRRCRPRCRSACVAAAFHHVPAKELGDLDHPIETDVLICSDHPEATELHARSSRKIPNMRPARRRRAEPGHADRVVHRRAAPAQRALQDPGRPAVHRHRRRRPAGAPSRARRRVT